MSQPREFRRFVMPVIRSPASPIIANDVISVQPMTGRSSVFYPQTFMVDRDVWWMAHGTVRHGVATGVAAQHPYGGVVYKVAGEDGCDWWVPRELARWNIIDTLASI